MNTRQQTERRAKEEAGDADVESSRRGTLFQMLQVIKTEGWGGLYSGLKPSLVGTAASQVCARDVFDEMTDREFYMTRFFLAGDILFLLPGFQEQGGGDCGGTEEERAR